MKKILPLVLTLACASHMSLAEASFSDINYRFDQQKISVAKDAFHFARSFVDYYYGLVAKNSSSLHISALSNYSGSCVGDAHAENFGILLQNDGSPTFTMNDMDDFGPCPLAYDFLRLLVTTRLYLPKSDIKVLTDAYTDGLKLKSMKAPDPIKSLTKTAIAKGMDINPKDLNGNKLLRKSGMEEVSASILQEITSNVQSISSSIKVMDAVATSKVGGGSGGLQRYELLVQVSNKDLIHLELKELVTPSIAPVATAAIPDQRTRMLTAIHLEQGNNASGFYNVYTIGGKSMLLRPKFEGNVGVTLADSSDKDNFDIITYEAFILGRIHAASAAAGYRDAVKNLKQKDLESDVDAFASFMINKYNSVK